MLKVAETCRTGSSSRLVRSSSLFYRPFGSGPWPCRHDQMNRAKEGYYHIQIKGRLIAYITAVFQSVSFGVQVQVLGESLKLDNLSLNRGNSAILTDFGSLNDVQTTYEELHVSYFAANCWSLKCGFTKKGLDKGFTRRAYRQAKNLFLHHARQKFVWKIVYCSIFI